MVFMKPESAVRRAEELISVGRDLRALETLFEVITSRRHRTWTKEHEPLMEKFLDLCVELKKSQKAKDGLYQYKTITQTIAVKSLEDAIMRFLRQGDERCSQARKDATNALIDIDDLEVIQTPENLLLSAVSGESQQDRTDRDMLAPWLKFVWESYKQCLELLKNNNRVEKIYHEVARMGFQFCRQYNRRPEFRKLCDTIRTHFQQSQKYAQQAYSINFQSSETQQSHLDTRMNQLDTAITMELWQEAFKAIEDIYTLTTISKRSPRAAQLASYYNKVALVFWKAGNYIFHATTVLKVFVLHKEQKKNITIEELRHLSTKALLSILSIALPTPRTQIDEHLETEESLNEKQKRLTSLLSLQQTPTRATLIRDMIRHGVLNYVDPDLKTMYEWLEVEFNPLKLSSKIEESIAFVESLKQPEYSQYMKALREITVVRLLQQISQVYQTIELKRFIDLAPKIDKHHLEKIVVNAARNNDVQVRIEHKLQALTFGTNLNLTMAQANTMDTISPANVIQKMPNEQIRYQLVSMSRVLHTSIDIINEKFNKDRNDKLRREIASTYARDELVQRKEMLKRKEIIERYKEDIEIKSKEKVRILEIQSQKEQNEREQRHQAAIDDLQKKQRAELEAEREREEHRKKMVVAINKLRASDIGVKIINFIGEEKLFEYDPESLNSLHINAVIKEVRETKEKLRAQYKRHDYLIRAMHESEIALIQEHGEEELRKRREIQKSERERAIERSECLVRMEDDRNEFLKRISGQRHQDYTKDLTEFKQRLAVAREKRLQEVRQEYIENRKQDWRKQKELKKEKKLREKERKAKEKLDRQRKEQEEERRRIQNERRKELDKQAAIQRQREEEIENKLKLGQQQQTMEHSETKRGPAPPAPRHSTHQPEKDKTDKPWRPTPRNTDDNQQSYSGSRDYPNRRHDDQRPRISDRRGNESSGGMGASSDSWKGRQRVDQHNSAQQQGSPSSSTLNADTADNWRTVEKKRPNTDRPSQQRSDDLSSGGSWTHRQRPNDEGRNNARTGPDSAGTWKSGIEDSRWRVHERNRLGSWCGDQSDDENNSRSSYRKN